LEQLEAIVTDLANANPGVIFGWHELVSRAREAVAATPTCQSLRFDGPLDAEGHRCGRPEDDEVHDPLGSVPDCHPYDFIPASAGSATPSGDDHE